MSIVQLRQLFDKKGCQVVLVVIGILLAFGLLNTGSCGLFGSNQAPRSLEESVVATVAGQPVKYKELTEALEQVRKNRPGADPSTQFQTAVQALDSLVTSAVVANLAKSNNITLTDSQATELFRSENQAQVDMVRSQMVSQGVIKQDADMKAVDAAFKQMQGVTLTEASQAAQTDFETKLKDPAEREKAIRSVLIAAVRDKYRKDANDSLDDLKKSYEEFVLLRLPFDDTSKSEEERQAAAEKAVAELEGGAKFADVMAKYNPKASKEPMKLAREILSSQESLKSILDLKKGGHSQVLNQFGTPTVFLLQSVNPGLPADFDKNKDQFLQSYRQSMADRRLGDEITKLKSSKSIKWSDPALEYLYEVNEALTSQGTSPAEREKLLVGLVEKGESVTAKTPIGDSIIGLSKFAAFSMYYGTLSEEERADKRGEWIEVLNRALEDTEDTGLRLQLYDAELEEGNFEQATETLKGAIATIYGFEAMDIAMVGEVKTRLEAAGKNPKIQKEWLQGVKDELQRWETGRVKADAEQKQLEEEQRKFLEEDAKREAEEKSKLEADRKAVEAEKKAGGG
ncbi:MAG: SurA N-terminal domain-containing protein [Fimbriimonadaceae bacterium]